MAEQTKPKQSRGASYKRAISSNLDSIPESPALRKAIASKALAKRKAIKGELIRPVGRPSKFTHELGDEICELIGNGKSMRQIAKLDHMPEVRAMYRWLRENEQFRQQYALAKTEELPEAMQEKIHDVAERTLTGEYDALAARVAIDAYKWTASKLKPKKYGDKVDLTSDGQALPTPILGIINPSPTDETQRLQSGE